MFANYSIIESNLYLTFRFVNSIFKYISKVLNLRNLLAKYVQDRDNVS